MEGISVRSLYLQIGMSVVILLYLLDNETSKLILFSNAFGIVLELWKLQKAAKVSFLDKFPFIKIEDRDTYALSETKKYDQIAMKYMSYACYPLIVGYTIYSLFYSEQKGWYSFVLNTLVGFIYVFGFV